MKRFILLTCIMSLLCMAVKAQSALDSKLKKGTDALNGGAASAKGALNSADSLKQTGKKLKDQFTGITGIKLSSARSVVINVPGANRAKLRELSEIIQACDGVKKNDVDYDDSKQIITIGTYKKKLNDLLKDIQKRTQLVTDDNTHTSPDTNSITINL